VVSLEALRISPDVEGDGAGVLTVPRATLAVMLAHVENDYPNEGCGLLVGAGGRVAKHYTCRNASETPRTFSEVAPEDLLAIWDDLEPNGWELLAYVHSHPASPAYPSKHDIHWSQNWPGMFYIIFSLADREQPVVRAFLIEGEHVAEYRLALED
jgi:[CysO sulfur-carrier protein]-S-L-cysteine hydrolase